MPPSLPTATVSRPTAGTRTFPPESDADTDRARVAAGSARSASTPTSPSTSPSTSTNSPAAPSSGVVPRREHDAELARLHDRVAELEAENDALRDHIEKQATERRAVVERYERLLDRRDATAARAARSTPTDESTTGVVDAVRSALGTLRSGLSRLVSRG